MPNVNIKGIPRELHRRLKERALQNRRSLNSEVIACLEKVVLPQRVSPDDAARRIRALRATFAGPPLTDRELARLKTGNRP